MQSTERPLGLVATAAAFGVGALALYVATRPLMSALAGAAALRPDVSWFLAGGALFAGLAVAAAVALGREGHGPVAPALSRRCRFRRMGRREWTIAALATVAILGVTAVVQMALKRFLPGFSTHPPFLEMHALAPSERWVLLAWLPMFALNILGEELLWHGYLLPRNEVSFGTWAWLVNGSGWLIFHVPFGRSILLLVLPTVFIETYAIQSSRNTWVGVVIHALVNGPAFVAISLGWIR